MTPPPPSRPATIALMVLSIALQVVTVVALMLELSLAGYHPRDSTSAIFLVLVALIPLMAQALICRIKNEPIIHTASLVASCAVLAVVIHDRTAATYVPLGSIAPWPIVFLVMTCGNVVAWIRESRQRTRDGHTGQGH